MRIRDILSEVPIDQFQTFDMDKPGTFSDKDKEMVTNPVRVNKIKSYFENTPFIFDLFFVNRVGKKHLDQYKSKLAGHPSYFYTDTYYSAMEKYIGRSLTPNELEKELGIKINYNPRAITVIYLSNSAEVSLIPLTPWMIAHRFTHTVIKDDPNEIMFSGSMSQAVDNFQTAVNRFIELAKKYQSVVNYTEFLTMKSARSNALNMTFEELEEELLTQFVIKGHVQFKTPQQLFKLPNGDKINQEFKAALDQINQFAKLLLKECVGKILVMP